MPGAERYEYSAIIDRPPLALPGDARLAVWFVLNVEHYEYLPRTNPQRDPWPQRPHPDVVSYARRDYGNRVGIWRMLPLLDRYGIRPTVSINAAVLDHYPEISAAMAARDWDYMAHGVYNTRYAAGLDEQSEREMIQDAIDTVRRHTGKMVSGWLGPSLTTSPVTPDLLAEAGVKYLGDYLHDDEPCEVKVRSGRIVSLPYNIHINDSPLIGRMQHSSDTFLRLVKDQFDELYREGVGRPKIMSICLHPYAVNAPSRQRYLEEAITYITSHDRVWFATGEELADLRHPPSGGGGLETITRP